MIWEDLVSFLINYSYKDQSESICDETRQRAIHILKQYFLTKKDHSTDLNLDLQLSAIVCIVLACKHMGKFEGNGFGYEVQMNSLKTNILSPMTIVQYLEFKIEVEDIAKKELEILQCLNFRMESVTPLEVSRLLLFLADPTFDYTVIMGKLTAIINFCLIDADINLRSGFSAFSIGLASTLLTFERMHWDQFHADFMEFLNPILELSSGLPNVLLNYIIQMENQELSSN